MTYEEAIREIQEEGMTLKSMELAIEALEKQTPKKPNYVHADEPLCPYCQEVINDGDVICESCHQLIDWSD